MKIEEAIKTKIFSSDYQRAIVNIMYTSYWFQEKSAVIFKKHGISEQQFNVLRILRGQKGNPINLLDVQSRMMHKMSNATRLVEKLRLKNYADRTACSENRRMVDIIITEKGLDLLKKIDKEIETVNKNNSEKFSSKELIKLSDFLDKLRE